MSNFGAIASSFQRAVAWADRNPIYPILLGWYSPLFLFEQSLKELNWSDLLVPWCLCTLGVTVAFLLFRLLWRDWRRAAALTSLLTLAFFAHGRIHTLIGESGIKAGPIHVGTDVFLLGLWAALIILVIVWLRFLGPDRVWSWQFSAIAGARLLLVLIPLVVSAGSLRHAAVPAHLAASEQQNVTVQAQAAGPDKPDIYYLVFDRYPGPSTLKQDYGYDDSRLTDYLEQQGFYVAKDSHTNYPRTSLSLASSLNMNYLNTLLNSPAPDAAESTTVYPLIRTHAVGAFLQAHGYEYIHVGSWFEPTKHSDQADVSIEPKPGQLVSYDSFGTQLLMTTMYPVLAKHFQATNPTRDWNENHRRWALFDISTLESVAKQSADKPRFVFGHILMPHEPLVMGPQCQSLPGDGEAALNVPNEVRQVECTNTLITSLIAQITSRTDRKTVVVLQSDEGPPAIKYPLQAGYEFKGASVASMQERSRILNAYLLPGKSPTELSQTISPVNSFRMVFNEYFGTSFPYLPDKTYVMTDEQHLFDLTDVSSKLW